MTNAEGVENPQVEHEESDVNIRAIFGFGAGLLVAGVLIHLGIWLLFGFFEAREARRAAPQFPLAAGRGDREPPEPRLQRYPREAMRLLRADEDAILESYGWVDKPAGVVRIPIDAAMKLAVQRGLPARSVDEKK